MTITPEDRLAIAELGTAYAGLLDNRRFAELSLLFCSEGVLHRADGSAAQGRAAIVAAQSARPAHLETVHHVSLPFIEPTNAGEVKGRTTFVALAKDPYSAAPPGWTIGSFQDIYRREDGQWRIAQRHVSVADRMTPDGKENLS